MSLNSIEVLPRSFNPSLSENVQAIERLAGEQLKAVFSCVRQLDRMQKEIDALRPACAALACNKLIAGTSPSPDQFKAPDAVLAAFDYGKSIMEAARHLEHEVERQRCVLAPIFKMLASEEVDA